MSCHSTLVSRDYLSIAMLVSSVPLSLKIDWGRLGWAIMLSGSRATRPPEREISADQGQTFPAEGVHPAEHPQLAAGSQGIRDKIR
jgi:hypothetical protein